MLSELLTVTYFLGLTLICWSSGQAHGNGSGHLASPATVLSGVDGVNSKRHSRRGDARKTQATSPQWPGESFRMRGTRGGGDGLQL